MDNGFIAIELSPLDAEYFVLFQKYFPKIKEMIDEGIFDIRGGRGIVDFRQDGSVDRIIKIIYSNKKNHIPIDIQIDRAIMSLEN